MGNLQATHPLQLVHLDYRTTEMTKGGKNVHMLVITNHFTRYIQALVTSSQTAKCTNQALCDRFVVHYGLPKSIISDRGKILRVTSFQSYASLQKSKNYVLALIIHRQTGSVNNLITH